MKYATAQDVLRAVLGTSVAGSKTNPKRYDLLTPTRLSHMTEMIERREVTAEVSEEAYNLLAASQWLQMPALAITPADMARLYKAAPWNATKPAPLAPEDPNELWDTPEEDE